MNPGRWNRNGRRPRERGFTLVEILVAMTIFAIAVGVAFVLYNAAQGSYREGEQFTEQQQNTRIAFDRIVADLRVAGFNYNPDGDVTRPDEQIEGAWDTAVTVRGDFDFEITPADDPTDNNVTPETALKGSFNTVTTGNSEIVTFALGKPDGGGGVDLIFNADVQESARDGDVEEVRIPGVHLDQAAPPYTLYRITLNNDETDYGTWSDFAVKQPVADHIKSLTFRYFDSAGNQLNAFDLTQTADDIGGDDASADVATRASIRRIEVDLVGLTPDPDLDFVDSADAIAATQNYRKFELTTDVVSQNLGLEGMPDLVLTAPRTPQNVTLCTGHCGGLIVDWDNAYAQEDAVTGYTVWYGTDPAALDIPLETGRTWAWIGGLGAGPYYFGVQARNGSEQASLMTNPVSGSPTDDTKPLAVVASTLWATGGSDPGRPALDSRIDVGWGAVTENTSQGASEAVTGCDPDRPVNRDLAGYRLYRSETSPVAIGTPIADETVLAGAITWSDTTAVNCRPYNYLVKAVDSCGTESDPSGEVGGYADTNIPPAAPTNVAAVQSSPYTIDVSWDAVTQNAATPPAPVQVAGYNIYVAEATAGMSPDSIPDSSYLLRAGPVAGTSYQYWFSYMPAGYSNYFKTTALDDCPNESQKSSGAESTCDFIGTLAYSPQAGASLAGTVPVSLSVTGPQTYARGRIRIRAASTLTDVYYEETWAVPFSFPSWNSSAVSAGTYEIFYEVENSNGCRHEESVTVTVNSTITCCVDAANPALKPITGKASEQNSNLDFNIANNCAKDVEIIGVNVSWTENQGGISKLQAVEYPQGTVVKVISPAQVTPVSASFLTVPLFLSQFNDSSSPIRMELDWDLAIADKSGSTTTSEIVTIRFDYRATQSAEQGFCTVQVSPDSGTIVDIDGS